MVKKKFEVTGMTCASCQAHVSNAVKKLDGTKKVEVNLLTGEMVVEFDETKLSPASIEESVQKVGYGAKLQSEEKEFSDDEFSQKWKKIKENQLKNAKNIRNRLIFSFALLIPLLYISMGSMIGLPQFWFFEGVENSVLFALVQLILTTVILLINKQFFISGFKAMAHRSPNMDSLVALGSSAAYVYGLACTLVMAFALGHGNTMTVHSLVHSLYFESAATILTLVTLGKYFETKSKMKTSNAIEKLANLTPQTATVIRNGKEEVIKTKNIQKGDIVLVRTGDICSVDGVILSGEGLVNQSSITGESVPVKKSVGDNVISASICENGSFEIRASKVGSDTTIAQIIKLVDEASSSKAPISKIADRVSGVFVPIVIGLAILTFVIWIAVSKDFSTALSNAISVLVISCPCALGLATPVAIMVGTGRATSFGVLIKSAEKLELLQKATTIVFDKTGTITYGKPEVTDLKILSENYEENYVKQILCAIEAKSKHPLAFAIYESLKNENLPKLEVSNFEEISGKGVHGKIDKKDFYIGNLAFASEKLNDISSQTNNAKSQKNDKNLQINDANLQINNINSQINDAKLQINAFSKDGKTAVLLFDEKEIIACVAVTDKIRETSVKAVQDLQMLGLKTVLLTGDNKDVATAVAEKVNVENVISDVLPDEKDKQISKLQSNGEIVVMVGDGINDSPALSRADIGIAVSSGTDIAIDSADIVLTKNSLEGVTNAILLSRAVMGNIKMNLFWAFFYNGVSIPIAMGLLIPICNISLSPMIASLAMSFSSVCVVLNALRLTGFNPEKKLQKIRKNNKNIIKSNKISKNISVKTKKSKNKKKENIKMKTIVVVGGMMCKNCERHVTEALGAVKGVDEVLVDLNSGNVTLYSAKKLDDNQLKTAVEDAGYTVIKIAHND